MIPDRKNWKRKALSSRFKIARFILEINFWQTFDPTSLHKFIFLYQVRKMNPLLQKRLLSLLQFLFVSFYSQSIRFKFMMF
mmetsp:Transcript_117572/g.175603  ORF Transcript_117572/g.175603 Transcript_117572/m.175603 type:complete len:81 (-) Transcript_117572:19-261(-)